MARGLLVATGVVATVSGVLLLAAGGVVASTFGSDGRVSTEPARVTGSGVAVLVEGLTVDAGGLPVPDGVGSLTLTATSVDGRSVFLATARDDDLDGYLTGAPYDVVASLSPGSTAPTRPVPGTLRPQPPVDADIWVASATGAPARLPARVPDGTTLVVMRPDAEPGVDADLVVTLEVDRAWPAALVGLGAGLVLLLLGLLLLRFGLRRDQRGAHSAAVGADTAAAPTVAPVGEPTAGRDEVTAAPTVDDPTQLLPVVPPVPTMPPVAPADTGPPATDAPTEQVPVVPVVPVGVVDAVPVPDEAAEAAEVVDVVEVLDAAPPAEPGTTTPGG